MESADIISPFTALARLIDKEVLPTAVGPVKNIRFFTHIISYLCYSHGLNNSFKSFLSSYLLMDTITGLPWGQ